jgi:hypothetical protein
MKELFIRVKGETRHPERHHVKGRRNRCRQELKFQTPIFICHISHFSFHTFIHTSLTPHRFQTPIFICHISHFSFHTFIHTSLTPHRWVVLESQTTIFNGNLSFHIQLSDEKHVHFVLWENVLGYLIITLPKLVLLHPLTSVSTANSQTHSVSAFPSPNE